MQQLSIALGAILVFIFTVVVIGLLLSLPVMWLWNACLVGAVAGINPIGWWQAFGILILCGFLFKSSMTTSS